jgi:hypothetical protein
VSKLHTSNSVQQKNPHNANAITDSNPDIATLLHVHTTLTTQQVHFSNASTLWLFGAIGAQSGNALLNLSFSTTLLSSKYSPPKRRRNDFDADP